MRQQSPEPVSLSAGLRDVAASRPDQPAVRSGEDVVTYGELDRAVDAAAAALIAAGVEKGDRVALMLGNGSTFVAAFYGALRAGAAVVPVNTSLTSGEIAHELTDCAAKAMVVGRAYAPAVRALQGTLPELGTVFLANTSVEPDAGSGMRSWRWAVESQVGETVADVTDHEDVALLAYTSGTSGAPKAAMLTHGNLLANQRQLADSAMGVSPEDVVFTALPLFHSYALNVAMGMTLSSGALLELVERFEPASALRLIAARGVTVIVGAPPMYVAWLNTPGAEDVNLSGVRLATSGAAPLPTKTLRRCAEDLSLDIREGYGLAEAGPVVTSSAALEQAVPGSAGPPLTGVEVRVVVDDRPAEEGDPGSVQVRGPNVFSGYWRAPEATDAVLRSDGWLETGDVGYLDKGLLYLVDRLKDVIIVSGFNVYPVEVEEALTAHPAVAQAAVVGVPHPYTGEAVKAFVVRAAGEEVTADELIDHAGTRVARFKQPDTIEFVAELPTLPTGKMRRRLLRDL